MNMPAVYATIAGLALTVSMMTIIVGPGRNRMIGLGLLALSGIGTWFVGQTAGTGYAIAAVIGALVVTGAVMIARFAIW